MKVWYFSQITTFEKKLLKALYNLASFPTIVLLSFRLIFSPFETLFVEILKSICQETFVSFLTQFFNRSIINWLTLKIVLGDNSATQRALFWVIFSTELENMYLSCFESVLLSRGHSIITFLQIIKIWTTLPPCSYLFDFGNLRLLWTFKNWHQFLHYHHHKYPLVIKTKAKSCYFVDS